MDITISCEGVKLRFFDAFQVVVQIMHFVHQWRGQPEVPTFDIELSIRTTPQHADVCRGAFTVRPQAIQ